MIKLFKNIRLRLLRENRFTRYLIYALGEIILVVIGILIALQIDNWNEKRKEARIVQNYYDQLLSDLKTDIAYSENRIDKINGHRQQYFQYKNSFEKADLMPTDVAKLMQDYSTETYDIEYATSTTETLISTGDIKLFKPSLRALLSKYNKYKLQTTEINRASNREFNDLLKQGALSGGITIAIADRLKNQSKITEDLKLENKFPDFYMAFESYYLWRDVIENSMIKIIEGNIKLAKEVIEAIESDRKK